MREGGRRDRNATGRDIMGGREERGRGRHERGKRERREEEEGEGEGIEMREGGGTEMRGREEEQK